MEDAARHTIDTGSWTRPNLDAAVRRSASRNEESSLGFESGHSAEFPWESADERFIRALHALFDRRLDDTTLSVCAMAAEMAVSRRVLYRELDRILGVSPSAYLRRYRLEVAHRLIRARVHKTISSVAYRVAMTQPYLTRAYKARYGMTPGQALRAASSDRHPKAGASHASQAGADARALTSQRSLCAVI